MSRVQVPSLTRTKALVRELARAFCLSGSTRSQHFGANLGRGSLQDQVNSDGSVSHRVLFRHRGRQTSLTLPDRKWQLKAKKLIEEQGT